MLVCEEINFELPPKIIVLNPKDGAKVIKTLDAEKFRKEEL